MAATPNPQKKIDLQAFRHHLATMPLPPLQDMPQQEPSQISDASAQPSTWDKVLGSGGAILEGITLAPGGFYDTFQDAWNGGNIDVTDMEALKARRAREQERADYVRKYKDKAFGGVADAMVSMPYSATTMAASLGAGAVGSLATPAVGVAAGMAASGAIAYRASKQQFLQRMLDQTAQVLGRMPTQEEWDKIAAEFDSEATKSGLWEAVPEALSNLFMAKLLGPLGKKMFKGTIGNIAKRGLGLYGEEFATETITGMGQGYAEYDAGLRDTPPNPVDTFLEIAPATFWQTTLMGGAKKGADILYRRYGNQSGGDENVPRETEDTPETEPQESAGQTGSPPHAPTPSGPFQPGEALRNNIPVDLLASENNDGDDNGGGGNGGGGNGGGGNGGGGNGGGGNGGGGNGGGGRGAREYPGVATMAETSDASYHGAQSPEYIVDFGDLGSVRVRIERFADGSRAVFHAESERADGGMLSIQFDPGMSDVEVISRFRDSINLARARQQQMRSQTEQEEQVEQGEQAGTAVPGYPAVQAGQRPQIAQGIDGGMISQTMEPETAPSLAQAPGSAGTAQPGMVLPTSVVAPQPQAGGQDIMGRPETPVLQQRHAAPAYLEKISQSQTSGRGSQATRGGIPGKAHPENVREDIPLEGSTVPQPPDVVRGGEQHISPSHSGGVESSTKASPVANGPVSKNVSEQRREILDSLPEDLRQKHKGKGLPRLKEIAREYRRQQSLPEGSFTQDRSMVEPTATPFVEENNARQETETAGNDVVQRLQQGDVGSVSGRPSGNSARSARGSVAQGNRETSTKGPGRSSSIKIPNHADESVSYELVELDDIHPSHLPDAGFQKNPAYQLENERRYHDEPGSQSKVLNNASQLDPSFLLESVDANHGAPVVDRRGNVLGGNGRAMSIQLAYARHSDRALAYRQALRDRAESLGLEPSMVDSMQKPVLVRRLDRDMSARESQALVSSLNDSFTDSKNSRAAGKSRGDRLSRKTLEALGHGLSKADTLRQYFDTPESAHVVEMLVKDGVIQTTERNAYIGPDGLLNPDGKRIVEEALRGRVAQSYDVLASLPGSILAKIDAVIPNLLVAESIGGRWNITGYMSEAIDLMAEFRASSEKTPETFLMRMDMLKGSAPVDRYSQAAQILFLNLNRMKKEEFVLGFAKFAAHAKLSVGGMGIGKTANQAAHDFLGIRLSQKTWSERVPKGSFSEPSPPVTAGGHIRAGVADKAERPLGALARTSLWEKAPTSHSNVEPYRAYRGQSDDMGESITKGNGDSNLSPAGGEAGYGTADRPNALRISEHFAEQFQQGAGYSSILEARRNAGELLGGKIEPGTEAAKIIDESIELGVVKAARGIVADMRDKKRSPVEIFRALVDLYHRQPRLSVRTSTSVAQQAYSTPAPIAYLASRLAGIDQNTGVLEPTAGNGMLLIEAGVDNAVVNELNHDRAARLRSLGFEVTTKDAVEFSPPAVDVVIANPPFGRIKDDKQRTREFSVNGLTTKELDHAIVARALGALKKNGRAVLIIGGKQGPAKTRSQKYRAAEQVRFWSWLFEHYKVLDHFSIDGKLYERQGAGYPIDIIVLENSGQTSGRLFPGAAPPRVYTSFSELEEVLHGQVVDTTERKSGYDHGTAGGMGRSRNQLRDQSDLSGGDEARKANSGSGRSGGDTALLREESGERRDPGLWHDGRGGSGESGSKGDIQRSRKSGDDVSSGEDVRSAGGRGQADLSAEVQQREPGQRGGRGNTGGLGGRSDSGDVRPGMGLETSPPVAKKPRKHTPTPRETVFQIPYEPASNLSSMGTLVPRNMATAVTQAMADLEKRHGNIDTYVADQLGYPAEQLEEYFSAEQVDALALAMSNISDGSGFIIGDQTGIGKGRVNAGIIRWAKRQGYIPVFVTMKPDLYADMVRDLSDIGMKGFNPLPTNAGLSGNEAIHLPDGRVLKTMGKGPHEKILRNVMENGLGEYDAVFTTYDQLNPVKGRDTFRRTFLMNIAPRAVFILDESHNAGGQVNSRKKASDADDRAQFVRKMLKASQQGAFYSSATYAKRPDVMSLYFKTDMQYAAEDMGKLAEAIERGGIPMQQVVAAELAKTGQYLRRERSFEGAEVQTATVVVDKERAEKCAEIMRAIMAFDAVKEKAVERIDKEAAGFGGRASDSGSTGERGAFSTNFAAIMHNVIAQSLLAQKIGAVVDATVAAIERGEKVVITLANTMGSMIGEHAVQNNIAVGAPIHFTFNDMFRRYLEKSRQITLKDGSKNKETRRITDEELGADGVMAFNNALRVIDSSDFGELPVSIIDKILVELESREIKADEITGRTERIDYSTNPPTYARRTSGPSERIKVVDAFNSGEIDVVILNQSGSTGISLHASERFKDQRRRNMIIAQPEANIDVFMQTLGRVFRTGQVVPPTYQLVLSDLPAEKRPAAILAKKMSSLNANTTASRDSDTSFKNIPDFLNKHGDRVAAQVMEDNPDLHKKMGSPLKDFKNTEDAMRKVTGRIPLLRVEEQRQVYELLESEYTDYIAQLEAMGGTGLEAKSLPLDARLIEEVEIVPAKDMGKSTPFAGAARLGTYDVKKLGKPWPAAKVREMVQAAEIPDMEKLHSETMAWHKRKAREMSEEAAGKQLERLDANYRVIYQAATTRPGSPVLISGKDMLLEGILLKLYRKGGAENPLALGAWKMDIALPDASRRITIPLSQTIRKEDSFTVSESRRDPETLYALFDSGQKESREKVHIITGNILAAYQKINGKGNVITFQDHEGRTLPGILLPRDTNPQKLIGEMDVSLSPDAAMRFLKELPGSAVIKSADKLFSISFNGRHYSVYVPSSKAKGAQFFLNGAVLQAAGKDFVKSGQSMALRELEETQASGILRALSAQGYGFVADNNRDRARALAAGDGALASLGGRRRQQTAAAPAGQFLPPQQKSPRHTPAAFKAMRRAVAALNARASNGARAELVATQEELPARLRQALASQTAAVEGVYDPATGVVWLIAENLASPQRAVEVWAHETLVHHGLRATFNEGERRRLLNGLWLALGGMKHPLIAETARRYGKDPRSDSAARLVIMEETLAKLAEQRGKNLLDAGKQRFWRRVVAAVLRAWHMLVRRVTGRSGSMDAAGMERLLDSLQGYVLDGKGVHKAAFLQQEGALASLADAGLEDAHAAWRQLQEDMAAWGRLVPVVPTIERFDDADMTPLASLAPDKIVDMNAQDAARVANEPEVARLLGQKDLGILKSAISLPHWVAKRFPGFAHVYNRQLERQTERSAAQRKSLESIPSLFGKKRLSDRDMDSLRKLLWELEGKETLDEKESGVSKFRTQGKLDNGRELIEVNPEFYNVFQKMLDASGATPGAKQAMMEIRKSLDNDLVLAHNRMAGMSELNDNVITAFRQSIGHIPNYFPHHRYGRFYIKATVDGKVVYREHFDALDLVNGKIDSAQKRANEIREKHRGEYPGAKWAWGENKSLPDEVLGAPVDATAMEQIILAATEKIADKEQASRIAGILHESVANVLKSRGWGAHGIRRSNIPGHETQDIIRVLYDYKMGLNGWLTKMDAARDFAEALSKIEAKKQPELWKYTAQYMRDMLQNSDRIDRIVGNIKAVAFAWYLGGSIKTAVVNATQNLVVGVPRLQMDITGGWRMFIRGAGKALVSRFTNGGGLNSEEARLIHELWGEGIITDAYMEEIRGQMNRVPGANLWNKFTSILGLPMAEVERFNRASLALAAFKAARSGRLKEAACRRLGVRPGENANYEQAKAFASEVVNDAHFVYGKANLPQMLRSSSAGRAASSMYTFRTFSHNMLSMWAWALSTQGKEGRAFIARSLGATMALGGLTAFPFYGTLAALLQALGYEDDPTEKLRKKLPNNLMRDLVCYGVPSIAGVNIGGSLQMETPFTEPLAKGASFDDVVSGTIKNVIGIPWSMLQQGAKVASAAKYGDTYRMIEEAMPVFGRNLMQAWRLYTKGQTTMSGRPINMPGTPGARKLTSSEAVGKALGFQPLSSTKSYAAYSARKFDDSVRNDKLNDLTVLWLEAMDGKRPAARGEAMRMMREWNIKVSSKGDAHMMITLKDVLHRAKARRRENRPIPGNLREKQRQQDIWGI